MGLITLLERGEHLAILAGALAAVTEGDGGRLVLVGGEAGAGKTTLARRFTDGQPRSVQLLWGSCDALFTPRALGPFLPIAETTGGPLAELVTSGARPHEVVAAVLDELRGRPTIVVVEDVHWADQATLDVLRLLGRQVATTRALVLATYRDDELGRSHPLRLVLGELPPGPPIERLHLAPLSRDAVARLATEGDADVDVDALHDRTGGNAFFVTEALAARGTTIPDTVRDAVLARAARLTAAATRVLEAAAVVTAEPELWLLDRMIRTDDIASLEECLDAGVLVATRGGVAFRHELARLAIAEALPPDRSRALHRAALLALADPAVGTPDPARLAHHAEAAHDAAAVLEHAPAAAERAASVGAHREAAAHYAQALRFASGEPAEVLADLHSRRAHEAYLVGRFDDAIEAQRHALEAYRELDDRGQEGEALTRLARYRFYRGDVPGARQQVRDAVALLQRVPPGRELAWAYSSLAMFAEDLETVQVYGNRAIELAGRLEEAEVLSHALTNVGAHELLHGVDGGREKLDRSLEVARASGSDEAVVRAYSLLVMALVRVRDHEAAEAALPVALEYSTERDLASHRLIHLSHQAILELDQGRWREALETATTALQEQTEPYGLFALPVIALVRARRGEPDAWEPLEAADSLAPTEELLRSALVSAAKAELYWLEGRDEEAVGATEAAFALALEIGATWATGPLAYWRWQAGVREPLPAGIAEPYRAQLEGDWQRAAELWDELGCPYEAALARADADDTAVLRQALEQLQELGAKPAAERVAQGLRERGVRGLPRGPQTATAANPANLTPRQVEVLALLSEGLTNGEIADRLFLSTRTVDHHVSAILRKLEVPTRAEASAEATRLGLVPDGHA